MLWNSDNGTLKQTLRGHLEPISSLAFSPDSRSLATAAGREIKLWDIGKIPDQVLKKPLDGIQFVVFSRDGLLLASTSRIGSVKIWDTKSGTALHTLEGHTKTADHAAFSSDGSVLISASFHGETVIIWDVVSGEKLHTLESPGQVYSVSISSDDHHIATAAFNGGIGIWSVSTGLMSRKLKVDEPVDDVKFGPAGKLLASASRDEKVRLWDVEKGAVLHSFEGFAFGVQCLSFSPSGKLLACGSHEGIVRVWDIESGRRLQEDRLDGPIFPNAIAFSKNENFLKTNDGLLLLQGRSNVDQSLRSTVSSTQKWLCRGLSRMLRIPPDYRTRSSGSDTYPAVDTCGQLAALGHESGQVIFIEISTSD
ncbi:hypothetical protein NW762_012464 [Fusarium torreyae]|uniref:WD40 repeat domain-containing protein n=1 Tax=Fusarium torreyae TaxID=1237075 RepID=A0A9W8RR77_9HYPO|nr:hypothetical protein NW762_012464 [Fusarium torreyae]